MASLTTGVRRADALRPGPAQQSHEKRINEETPWHILPVVTMLVCTVWLTFQLEPVRQDRKLLPKDLVEQCWKIQADMSGLWETLPSGQLQLQLPNQTDPSLRKHLIDASERDESMRQLLFEIRTRLDELESAI